MTYHILPHPADLDEEGVQRLIQFCQANGIDPLKIPAPDGDAGFGLQIHGDTIRFREYVFDGTGRVVLDARNRPTYTEWGERPLAQPPFLFGLSSVKVRA